MNTTTHTVRLNWTPDGSTRQHDVSWYNVYNVDAE